MPKRLRDDEMDAALQAGAAPSSADHPRDAEWHEAQNAWLRSWRSDVELPKREDKTRRSEWDKLTKMHARALAAAAKRDEEAREARETAAVRKAVAQEAAAQAAKASAQEMTTQQVPVRQVAVKHRAAQRQTATEQTADGEEAAVEAAEQVAVEVAPVPSPVVPWSPRLTLSATPIYYNTGFWTFWQDGYDWQDSDGHAIRAHIHEGIYHWNLWGVMLVWPPPCNPRECGPFCKPCDRSPCDEGVRWLDTDDRLSDDGRKARWLTQSPEVELPAACALFGCSGCPHVPVRSGRNMPRRYPWPPNQSPWFSESYSAQVRAKEAEAVIVQRDHEFHPGIVRY